MILLKKAIRSMWDNKSAYIACIVLIMLGIAIYVGMGIAAKELYFSQEEYYEDNRLADVFATVQAIPPAAEKSLLQIEGVEAVNFRLVHDARITIAGNEKIITMRLISVDTALEEPINKLNIQGRGFYSEGDVLVSQEFLEVHGMAADDTFRVIIDAKERELTVCGTASSPEYVYSIKDVMEMLPDAETFSVAYMPRESLANLLNRQNEYNDIVFTLKRGYTYDDVKLELEDALQKYGMTQMYPRKDQLSYTMLESEIDELIMMSGSIPYVFVLMAITVLYLMLKRVIEQDRMQIGTMKAFGYTNLQILGHYLVYGLVTGVAGGLLGAIFGWYLSGVISKMFEQFFSLPEIDMSFAFGDVAFGFFIGVAGGVGGAFMGTRSVLKLTPAESMRAEAPKPVKSDVFRFIPFMRYLVDSRGSMAIRSISRSKFRSAFIVMGVMFSYSMLAFMASYTTMVDDMLLNHFKEVQRYDGSVSLTMPVPYDQAVAAVSDIAGVTSAEGILEVPVELSHRHRTEGIVITGLDPGMALYHIFDNDARKRVDPPEQGIILTNILADSLEAKRGDVITIQSPLLTEDTEVVVWDVVTQNLGSSSYMMLASLQSLFRMENYVSTVVFNTEDMAYIKDFLKEGGNVAMLEDKAATLASYQDLMASYQGLLWIMEGIAIVIAVAIIYNTAVISLSERKREYATLRVLGMHIKEVGEIMAFEYWLLMIFGVLLGIPFTSFLKEAIAAGFDMDMFTFPTYTPPMAYLRALAGCIVAVLISNRSCVKKIRGFDMVEVLKERE